MSWMQLSVCVGVDNGGDGEVRWSTKVSQSDDIDLRFEIFGLSYRDSSATRRLLLLFLIKTGDSRLQLNACLRPGPRGLRR